MNGLVLGLFQREALAADMGRASEGGAEPWRWPTMFRPGKRWRR